MQLHELEPQAEWRAAEIPAANGHGTARAVAAVYGIFAGRGWYGGRRVLSAEAAERVREGQGSCRDLVLGARPPTLKEVPVQKLLMSAAVDLLPRWARDMHGLGANLAAPLYGVYRERMLEAQQKHLPQFKKSMAAEG